MSERMARAHLATARRDAVLLARVEFAWRMARRAAALRSARRAQHHAALELQLRAEGLAEVLRLGTLERRSDRCAAHNARVVEVVESRRQSASADAVVLGSMHAIKLELASNRRAERLARRVIDLQQRHDVRASLSYSLAAKRDLLVERDASARARREAHLMAIKEIAATMGSRRVERLLERKVEERAAACALLCARSSAAHDRRARTLKLRAAKARASRCASP